MEIIGVIGGTILPTAGLLKGAAKRMVKTPYGSAELAECGPVAFINRHGRGDIPPHMINHKANIWALKRLTDEVIGVGSTGSLRRSLKPPAIVVPDDFIQFDPPTFFEKEIRHTTPAFDPSLRERIIKTARRHRIRVKDRGTYMQTKGPRLETGAEVRMLSGYADIVGMTLASEATLACELGLRYAAICSVDNLANGLAKKPLDFREIADASARNKAAVEDLLEKFIGEAI
jgi:purine nucleoside phosphorylase